MKVEFCPWPIQVEVALLSRKQPPVSVMPPANVAVAFPTVSWFATFKLVVVALVPVEEVKVRVEMFALVAKKSVEVAAVDVESPMVKNCAVDDAEKIPDVAVKEPTF